MAAVEQELIMEGLPESEVLNICEVHDKVLDGWLDVSVGRKTIDGLFEHFKAEFV